MGKDLACFSQIICHIAKKGAQNKDYAPNTETNESENLFVGKMSGTNL